MPPLEVWAAVQVPWNLINEYSSSWVISPIEISSPLLIRSPFILTSNKAFQGHYSCSTHQLRPFACHFIWKMGDACAHDSASARYFILLIISTIYINNKKTKTPLKSTKLILSVSFKNSTPPILFTKALQLFKTKKKKNIQNVSPPGGVDFPVPSNSNGPFNGHRVGHRLFWNFASNLAAFWPPQRTRAPWLFASSTKRW